MKKIIIKARMFMISLAVLLGTGLSARTVYTVTSIKDSGAGSLRQLIENAASGDSILIPTGYNIVLASEIAFNKSLAINGQDALVRVATPGVSPWRVFTLGTTSSQPTTVSMYNLNLEGGKLNDYGGIIFVRQNHTFTMKNCTLSKGKGTYAGAIFGHSSLGASIILEDCTISDCEATTTNGGALYVRGKIIINNCTFINNKSYLNGGAVTITDANPGCLISNSKFIGNDSHAPTGGAVLSYSSKNPVDLINCTFDSNTNSSNNKSYTTGAGGFALGAATGNSTLTNCTFYNNTGTTSGAIYNGKGTLNLVNCTFAGNSTPSAIGSGAYHDSNNVDVTTTLVNNVFGYNYNANGLMDINVSALSTMNGTNNIIGAMNGNNSPNLLNTINYSYGSSDNLFAKYTESGVKKPLLEPNGTILLASGSIALNAGIKNYTTKKIENLLLQFHATSPFVLNSERRSLWNKIEVLSDNLPSATFKSYIKNPERLAVPIEQTEPILYFYRYGFDKVLDEVKNTQVKNGTTVVWLLYNMGFVVKTPSGCFGIDINHRMAEQLEPYLDFLCITHNHGDHYDSKLVEAMYQKGKPILSNYYTKDTRYTSKVAASYKIGNFSIKTDISDHLRDPALPNFVTIFRIQGGEDSGNFSILHGGDTGFDPTRFVKVQGPVSVAVLRWGASRENNIFGTGSGQVQTNYAILSHLIELAHELYPNGQASISQTLIHLPTVKCANTILPFWGEKMTWENGKLQ